MSSQLATVYRTLSSGYLARTYMSPRAKPLQGVLTHFSTMHILTIKVFDFAACSSFSEWVMLSACPSCELVTSDPPPSPPGRTVPCSSGAVNFAGHCYQLLEEERSLTNATRSCTALGGGLVSIESLVENNFVTGESPRHERPRVGQRTG